MTSLPDYSAPYSAPYSPTQWRGKGIARNVMSDTWTDDAYIKPCATSEKIIDVERTQDRWRCPNCGHLNDRGVTKLAADSKTQEEEEAPGKRKASTSKSKTGGKKARRKSWTPVTVAGPSHASVPPVGILGSGQTGVGIDEHIVCACCGEELYPGLMKDGC